MNFVVAVIAPGAMGSAIGQRLRDNGAQVLTSLKGRGSSSGMRAAKAGMRDVDDSLIAQCDVIMSVVPPSEATKLVERLAPELALAKRKPVLIDCNAVSPKTVLEVSQLVAATGSRFIDGCIIGSPPEPGGAGPTLYVSGPDAPHAMVLSDFGLDMRLLDAPTGAASALKMAYAGITKGLTGLATAMILAATHAGAGPALRDELERSQAVLLKRFATTLPDMYPKAYRWVAEMQEIAQFAQHVPGTQQIYDGLALLYSKLAEDLHGSNSDIALIDAFLALPPIRE